MDVALQFSDGGRPNVVRVSPDLLEALEDGHTPYASVVLPTYGRAQGQNRVFEWQEDSELPMGTVSLPRESCGVDTYAPAVDFCLLEPVKEGSALCPTVLDKVTFTVKSKLYSKIIELPTDEDRAQFMSASLQIRNRRTVVRCGQQFLEGMVSVASCGAVQYGLVDFAMTKIVLVEGINASGEVEASSPDAVGSGTPLQALPAEISPDLIPSSHRSAKYDNTLFVFADHKMLSQLMVNSGSRVFLREGDTSVCVRLFVLLQPHGFHGGTLYAHPRVKAMFPSAAHVSITKCIESQPVPTATSVTVARVGDWVQCQKQYQNIVVHQLKRFFISAKRVLRAGDLIPIVFDSSCASLMGDTSIDASEVFDDGEASVDTLVWFKIVEGEVDESSKILTEFTVNPNTTKLITSGIVSVSPNATLNRDYQTFYGLPQEFVYNIETFPYYGQLHNIISSSLQCIERGIDIQNFILLHSTSSNVGKSTLIRSIAAEFSTHLIEFDCFSLLANTGSMDAATKAIAYLKAKLEGVLPYTESAIIYLSHLDVLFPSVDPNQDPTTVKIARSLELELFRTIRTFMSENKRLIFAASVNDIEHLPSTTRAIFRFEIEVPVPTETQRRAIFEWYMSDAQLNSGLQGCLGSRLIVGADVTMAHLAVHSAGLTPIDIQSIVTTAKAEALRAGKNSSFPQDIAIGMASVSKAISAARDEFSVSIGAPKIPSVTWEDIGGVDQVKGEIMDTIDMPLRHPELFASGMKKRSGLLFYGPPGTGKTLMAKAIASNFALNFFSVKGPELLNMYIGESEANVRRVFQRAREAKPCVIFFDEIDSVAPKRGNQGDSGGVMDRIVSQLLAELDGMSAGGNSSEGVFVIGATNRPDLLDEALLRPGRFDKLLYLGIPDTDAKQLNILTALTRKFQLAQDVDLPEVARRCPYNYTGADFYALCADAMLNAMTRTAATVDAKLQSYNENRLAQGREPVSLNRWFDQTATPGDTAVAVGMQDFDRALADLVPSVSQQELDHYLRVKRDFEQ
ncbi:AAA family ATPase peroxin 6 [Maudiozyma humilis]|uniref:Peroxisomal ATPase PEX6 n=1 Tax=Maudiozyma humilis TaxID=51915 RepID=A0AAV5S3G2_MAUHU|nr:AAA family ATPase peroxin 6 [Kazachstania humilis]